LGFNGKIVRMIRAAFTVAVNVNSRLINLPLSHQSANAASQAATPGLPHQLSPPTEWHQIEDF